MDNILDLVKTMLPYLILLILIYIIYYILKQCIKFIGKDEQLIVENLTERIAINGSKVFFLSPFHKSSLIKKVTSLGPLEYSIVCNTLTGELRIEEGPKMLFLNPYDYEKVSKETAISLKATEYVRLLDKQTGQVRVEKGEQGRIIPTAYEVIMDGSIQKAISLKCFEYLKIEDKKTGMIRIERGEKLVFLGCFDEVVGSKQKAIEIDDETAVLIRNKRNGQQHLVTDKQIFIPGNDEEIIEVRSLIKLADYEACIVRGKDGTDTFRFGKNPDERSFFLPPHSQLVELCWSRGRRREKRDLKLKIIDLRPMFMSFEFNCRTADNVELILEGTFFWELIDLKSMLKVTSDTTGDVCNHARSSFIEKVSKVTLQEFMLKFNLIAESVYKGNDDSFYKQRGVFIHSLEVSGYRCASQSTALILEQIIQETTNRMNRLQLQESENEIQIAQIKGDINEENAKKELLQVQVLNSNIMSSTEGESEALKISSFMNGLKNDVIDLNQRIEMWKILRKTDALHEVCANGSKLYYTPNDVNLSIEDRSN